MSHAAVSPSEAHNARNSCLNVIFCQADVAVRRLKEVSERESADGVMFAAPEDMARGECPDEAQLFRREAPAGHCTPSAV